MDVTARIAAYVASRLPSDRKKWFNQYKDPKIVHDALWGTFRLQPHEVALIDTPLVQRLRYIHQTGAASLTYPSAKHSRFEHTLGVLYQAGRICSALTAQPEEKRFDETFQNNARCAAILHDTGHGPFSHTSEQYFSSMETMQQIKESDRRFKESGAGEILSYLITQSEPFVQFISQLNNHYRIAIDPARIGQIITGSMGDDRMYESEIIHGPFDADKLDYMHRDGMFSGLKMHVDLDRLYNSILVKAGISEGQQMTRLAGSMSGTSPLTQIMFNKMLLYTGIYHHHKVRAVDCMLWAIFDLAVNNGYRVGGKQLQTPIDFLELTDDLLLVQELTDSNDIMEIISAIRNRRLWKRALVIARRTVPEGMHEKPRDKIKGLFNDFVVLGGNDRRKILRRREIADRIWEEAGRPCKQHEVWLDIPKLPSMEEAERMWIDAPGQEEPVTLGEVLPIAEWVELYGTHKWRAHVFCPSDVRQKINQASKVVLEKEFGLKVNDLATQYANIQD